MRCRLSEGAPQLKRLKAKRCVNLTDDCMNAIAAYCSALECLELPDCQQLTAKFADCLHLHGVTARHFTKVVQWCPILSLSSLMQLDLSGVQGLTDDTLIALANASPSLKNIRITEMGRLTDRGIEHLANSCPQLTTLALVPNIRATGTITCPVPRLNDSSAPNAFRVVHARALT